MYYSKPPLSEPKLSKKSKKKNNNTNNKQLYSSEPLAFIDSPPKSLAISEDDYINDLSEYQEEILNTAFEEDPDLQDPSELSATCNEIFDLFKEKNLVCELDYANMIKICQDNAKWFLPVQAA